MEEAGRKKLWEEYEKTKAPEVREKIILEYAPLVKLVAGRLSMYLGYNVEYEDLVSYGVFGLIDAIDKFDTLKDVKFETYASLRIRGAILDQIRKMDWIPRTIRQKQKKIDAVIREIETKHGRSATDDEIAAGLGITNDEYIDWQSQMKVTNIVSLNEFMEQGSEIPNDNNSHSTQFDGPEEVIEKEELKRILAESLETLTEKERKVILLYYYEDLTLKEISSILEVSESRISQLHTRALQKMKVRLGSYMGILTDRN
ncbi:MAG: FliA/WhiG family RNA polymerase sigma factor [Muribaculaceae bacterium]|nr:FliA/WhiG family RNA polymerase sigma factor [Muribaculaceae bacterium]